MAFSGKMGKKISIYCLALKLSVVTFRKCTDNNQLDTAFLIIVSLMIFRLRDDKVIYPDRDERITIDDQNTLRINIEVSINFA